MTDNNDMAETMKLVPEVGDMDLQLDRSEKLRATALLMGIRYYTDTIIKDPEYLRLMIQKEEKASYSNDPEEKALWHLRPANVNGVIHCAQMFEAFLLGRMSPVEFVKVGDVEIRPDRGGAQTEVNNET